jgi:hypothetical protein
VARVGVDGNEKIGPFFIGDGGSRFERNESIVFPRVNDFSTQAGLQQLAQSPAHVEHEIFFFQTVGADRARVVASVAGIDYDFADLQPQHAG